MFVSWRVPPGRAFVPSVATCVPRAPINLRHGMRVREARVMQKLQARSMVTHTKSLRHRSGVLRVFQAYNSKPEPLRDSCNKARTQRTRI